MALVSESKTMLQDFEDLDSCTLEEIQKIIQDKRYQLIQNVDGIK
jgi:hypothetical protein